MGPGKQTEGQRDERLNTQRSFLCGVKEEPYKTLLELSLLKGHLRCQGQSRHNCRRMLSGSTKDARQTFMSFVLNCISKESKSLQHAKHAMRWRIRWTEISVAPADPLGSKWRGHGVVCRLEEWNVYSTSPNFTKDIVLCLKTKFLPYQSRPVWSMSAGR